MPFAHMQMRWILMVICDGKTIGGRGELTKSTEEKKLQRARVLAILKEFARCTGHEIARRNIICPACLCFGSMYFLLAAVCALAAVILYGRGTLWPGTGTCISRPSTSRVRYRYLFSPHSSSIPIVHHGDSQQRLQCVGVNSKHHQEQGFDTRTRSHYGETP